MLLCCAMSDVELNTRDDKIEGRIASIAKGDMDAMAGLYELIKTDVYAFALSKVENPSDAEDITHDTFIQIFKYSRRYTPQGKPLAWIFTIENNIVNKRFNYLSRLTPLEDDSNEKLLDSSEFESDVITNQFLRELLQILSKEEQEIITLHIVSGLKFAEIAKILEIPLPTVLSRYSRAIKKMQKYNEEANNGQ